MASLTTRKNGSRFITFIDAEGRPQTITLGKVARRYAEAVKIKVEDLVSAALHHHAPQDETARWLAGLDDTMIAKLARVGLAESRRSVTLSAWVKQYLEERKAELKPKSLRKLEETRDKLLGYFEESLPLRKVTTEQAAAWRQHLQKLDLSEASIKTHAGNVKGMLNEAVRRKLVEENPFRHLRSGATPSTVSHYVTPAEVASVIDACPNAEWKLLFGLARYAGLRIPSESHLLTWADVDFDKCRLLVRSPKTEQHTGHEQRMVPITPKLMELLQARFDEVEEGETHLVTLRLSGAARRRIDRILQKAKLAAWPKLWQTLRQSCEKEWAMSFPQYAVSKWIGHSITVSGRHYANAVPDELFERAAARPGVDEDEAEPATAKGEDDEPVSAQRQAQRKAPDEDGNGRKTDQGEEEACAASSAYFRDLPDSSNFFTDKEKGERRDSNPGRAKPTGFAIRLKILTNHDLCQRVSAKAARFSRGGRVLPPENSSSNEPLVLPCSWTRSASGWPGVNWGISARGYRAEAAHGDTSWTNTSTVTVGATNSSGSMSVQDGAEVVSTRGSIGSSGEGDVTIMGEGSSWVNTGSLRIGARLTAGVEAGHGVLSIAHGGHLSNTDVYIGQATGSSGHVEMIGPNASWTTAGSLYVAGGEAEAGGAGSVTIGPGAGLYIDGLLRIWDEGVVNVHGGAIRFDELFGPAVVLPSPVEFGIEGKATLLAPVTVDGGTFSGNGRWHRLRRGAHRIHGFHLRSTRGYNPSPLGGDPGIAG